MRNETPYDEGRRHFGLGYEIGDNPYRAGTDDAHDWIDGLLDARDAAKAGGVRGAAAPAAPGERGARNDPHTAPTARDVA